MKPQLTMHRQPIIPALSQRAHVVELMDRADCDEEKLRRTLDAFRWINRLYTGYRGILRRWIIADMLAEPGRSYRVADLGAGGCDIAVWLLRECRARGLRVSVLAVDENPRMIAYARDRYGHVPGLEFVQQDARDMERLALVDYVWGNHFLHHLGDDEIVALLRKVATLPLRRFVFSDLRRCFHAYYLHSLTAAVFFPDTFIGYDGRLSIRKGFTVSEAEALVTRAGIRPQTQIHALLPARIVFVGEGGQPQ